MRTLIGTGGIFASQPLDDVAAALGSAAQRAGASLSLLPEGPALLVDSEYVLYAAGLLADVAPEAAYAMAEQSLVSLEARLEASR